MYTARDYSNIEFAWEFDLEPQMIMISVIISAMIYGGILSLSLSYVPLLLTTSQNISRRMRNFLLVYVTFMVAISTVYIIITTIALTQNIFYKDPGQNPLIFFKIGIVDSMCTTLANWGADGFMLWRCAMLYDGISRRRRIALITVLVLMGLSSLASGILNILFGMTYTVTGVTVALNIFTAILITLRIVYFERYMRKAVGVERNSPYTMVIIICVESSALIVVFSLIYIILSFRQVYASYLPMQLLVHIYVLSPLLIIYRVARGRSVTIREQPSRSEPAVSAMRFELLPLSSGNIEV
ncbi:hypothetical protein BYT27DRAFT_7086065 [Phlegmacium glaucopus]|nr:hypothetical protein BYT27DRAFT_7086065 [Phlegmacium glaucopus]